MTLTAKCPCGHVFTFDVSKVSASRNLVEGEGAASTPIAYYPKCPKCGKQLTVPAPR